MELNEDSFYENCNFASTDVFKKIDVDSMTDFEIEKVERRYNSLFMIGFLVFILSIFNLLILNGFFAIISFLFCIASKSRQKQFFLVRRIKEKNSVNFNDIEL